MACPVEADDTDDDCERMRLASLLLPVRAQNYFDDYDEDEDCDCDDDDDCEDYGDDGEE